MMTLVTSRDLMEVIALADREDVDTVGLTDRLAELCDTPINTGAVLVGIAAATAEMMRSHHLLPPTMPEGGFAVLRVFRLEEGKAKPVGEGERVPAISATQIVIAQLNSDKDMVIALTRALVGGDIGYALETIVAGLALFRQLHGAVCRSHD